MHTSFMAALFKIVPNWKKIPKHPFMHWYTWSSLYVTVLPSPHQSYPCLPTTWPHGGLRLRYSLHPTQILTTRVDALLTPPGLIPSQTGPHGFALLALLGLWHPVPSLPHPHQEDAFFTLPGLPLHAKPFPASRAPHAPRDTLFTLLQFQKLALGHHSSHPSPRHPPRPAHLIQISGEEEDFGLFWAGKLWW